MKNFDDVYWNYSIKSFGQTETWVNGKLEITSNRYEMVEFDGNNPGKYGSLTSAIKGFLNDETNSFSEITLEAYDDDPNKFKLTTEIYVDHLGQPVNDVVQRRWEQGRILSITHVIAEVIFIKHEVNQSTIRDFLEIKNNFPKFKIGNSLKN